MSSLMEWLFGWSEDRYLQRLEELRVQYLSGIQSAVDERNAMMSRFSAEFSKITEDLKSQGYSEKMFAHLADCFFRCHSEWLHCREKIQRLENAYRRSSDAAVNASLSLPARMLYRLAKTADRISFRLKGVGKEEM